MDPLVLVGIVIGTFIIAIFNYYLNYAPGTTPEDFAIGSHNPSVQCDCCINYLILGAIAVGAVAVSSSSFETLPELLAVGLVVFFSISFAGFVGRHRRHREWREDYEMLQIAMGSGHVRPRYFFDDEIDTFYDEDEDEDL